MSEAGVWSMARWDRAAPLAWMKSNTLKATKVYQIDQGIIRLLWVGRERTKASFRQFFTLMGKELAAQIQFVCSDMWQPYLDVIRHNCSQALHILDRFHVVAKMNKALDEVRAAESRKMAQDGHEPLLKKFRWCVLKRQENLTSQRKIRLRDLLQLALYHSLGKLPEPELTHEGWQCHRAARL